MEKFTKKDIYRVPDGYFESLPEKILERKSKQAKIVYFDIVKYLAAATVVIGLIYFFTPLQQSNDSWQSHLVNEEIELYIDADYWQAEDILAFMDDPDGLLDEIIATEWSSMDLYGEDYYEDDLWY
ncbi:hypothetical protein [Arthrospiribacter ruber]|uniref:Uncharacterized protein n=1 Tax=Arthrospiribacter ruber TaxID=2487934 RepID=A0A951MAR9_9BACT|nr:hypothetical protein [Arthrospiribacter ruber]MBW3468176.1 hypothetical protein [Arthrospiribacter ruber]